MRFLAVPLIVAILSFPSNSVAASPKEPKITGIAGQVKGRTARVAFTVSDAFTPEMVEAIKSGIEVSFKSVVRIERVHRRWFDTTVGEIEFSRSVRYDALSRVYRLHRHDREEVLTDILDALEGMTRYDVAVPLSSDSERGKKYRAYVKTRLDRVGLSEPLRSIFFFSSLWDLETGWEKGYLHAP